MRKALFALWLSSVAHAQQAALHPRGPRARPVRGVADAEVVLAAQQRAMLGSLDLPERYREYAGPIIDNESDGAGQVRVGLVWDRTHYTAIYAEADDGVAWVVEPMSTPVVPRVDVYLGDRNRLFLFASGNVDFRGFVFHVGHDSHVYLPVQGSSTGGQLVLPDESRVDLYVGAPEADYLGGPYTVAIRSGRGRAWTPLVTPPPGLGCTTDASVPPGASGAWGPQAYLSHVENMSSDPHARALACLEPNLTAGEPDWLTVFRVSDNFVGLAHLVVDADPAQGPPLAIDLEDDIYLLLRLDAVVESPAQPYFFRMEPNQHIVPQRFEQNTAPSFLTQGGHLLWMNIDPPPGVQYHWGGQWGAPVVLTDYR